MRRHDRPRDQPGELSRTRKRGIHVQSDRMRAESDFLWLNGANKAFWTSSSLLGPGALVVSRGFRWPESWLVREVIKTACRRRARRRQRRRKAGKCLWKSSLSLLPQQASSTVAADLISHALRHTFQSRLHNATCQYFCFQSGGIALSEPLYVCFCPIWKSTHSPKFT